MDNPVLDYPVGFTGKGIYGNVIHNGLQLRCSVSHTKGALQFQEIPEIKGRWFRQQEYQIRVSIYIADIKADNMDVPIQSMYRFLR